MVTVRSKVNLMHFEEEKQLNFIICVLFCHENVTK